MYGALIVATLKTTGFCLSANATLLATRDVWLQDLDGSRFGSTDTYLK